MVPINVPRDGVFQTNYTTSLLMTNPNSGAAATDGFSITLKNWDANMTLKEAGVITIKNGNKRFYFTNRGEFGVCDTSGSHKFYVYGSSGFDGEVSMMEDLSVQGDASIGGTTTMQRLITHISTNIYGVLNAHGNVTLASSLTVGGPISVGNGLYCDAQGNMKVKHLKVTLVDWPDYVFFPAYRLMPLSELDAYIAEQGHLPGVPAATEVEKTGADLGEMNKVLMEKVEELTLYIIDLQKQIDELKSKQ